MKIITNNVPRDVVYGYELTQHEEVKKEFDYIDWKAIEEGNDGSTSFVRYKGEWIHLDDLEYSSTPQPEFMVGWDAYRSDTFFSGILVKFCEDSEQVIMGRYYA